LLSSEDRPAASPFGEFFNPFDFLTKGNQREHALALAGLWSRSTSAKSESKARSVLRLRQCSSTRRWRIHSARVAIQVGISQRLCQLCRLCQNLGRHRNSRGFGTFGTIGTHSRADETHKAVTARANAKQETSSCIRPCGNRRAHSQSECTSQPPTVEHAKMSHLARGSTAS
jgi:hypothetical protein